MWLFMYVLIFLIRAMDMNAATKIIWGSNSVNKR